MHSEYGALHLHELFEQQAQTTPDAVALVHETQELSYGELNRRANRLAHYLRRLGVKPESRVAIYMKRSFAMIEALLGVLKAGGTYLPLDKNSPPERHRLILEDSQPVAVLTGSKLRSMLHRLTGSAHIIDLTAEGRPWESELDTNPKQDLGLTDRNLSYVIFTSGSTGRPKGVMVEHRSATTRILTLRRIYEFSPKDRILQFASLAFDTSIEEIFGALSSGATLILRNDSWLEGPREFFRLCEKHRVSIADLPTRFWQSITEDATMEIPRCMRLIILGGETLEQATLAAWRSRIGHRPRLLNSYGPTECTVVATVEDMDRGGSSWRSIGHPLDDTRIYILDSDRRPVEPGVTGELFIAGPGVARGYLNRPELTAQWFLQDPLTQNGTRMYRTGDLGAWLPDGAIEFRGRNDEQVKIRGYRIELAEVESALKEIPDIRDAVAVVREERPGDKELVVYYTLRTTGNSLNTHNGSHSEVQNQLQAHLSAKLPPYMLPTAYVRLEAMPLTLSGKIDRKSLPAPQRQSRSQSRQTLTQEEELVCNLFQKVLGLDHVGLDDDFFQLGGHSLLVGRLLSQLRELTGLPFSWQTFAMHITPRRVVELISSSAGPATLQDPSSGHWLRESLPTAPLSASQERVWFIHQLDPDETAYRFAATISLRGALDVRALERALNLMVERHEIFRTTFEIVDGELVQRIHPFCRFDLPEYPLGSDLLALTERELMTKFHLDQMPLIRWTLVQVSEQEHVLIQVEHHLVHDAWSFNLYLSELTAAYKSFCDPRGSSNLPEVKFQFADYARWERRWLTTEAAQEQLDYWKDQLANPALPLQLPHDHARNPDKAFRGASLRIDLPVPICHALRSFAATNRVTLFMTMFAGFAALLHRYSGQDDIQVGSGIANRRHPDSQHVVGMFVNTVVLRCDLSGRPSFQEVLSRVRDIVLEAFEHQEFPLDKIIEVLQPSRVPGMNPLFQAMFSFDDSPFPGEPMSGLRLSVRDPLSTGGAKVDVNVTILVGDESRKMIYPDAPPNGITIVWEYNRDQFETSTAERMVGHYIRMLEALVADPQQPISAVCFISPDERHKVLYEWNRTERKYPRDKCVQELFEERVERDADAIAVVCGSQKVGYGELNRRANRLGHYLRELGVGPDDRVAVCAERSVEMVEALLGVWKAGGAYLPIDPEYPAERLQFMLKDSKPRILLTQRHLRGMIEAVDGAVPVLELGEDPAWRECPDENLSQHVTGVRPEHLAYVIYTSGTSGQPKGVMNEHCGLVNRLVWMQSAYSLTKCDTVLQKTPFSFDVSVWEFFWPLLYGARLIIAKPRGHRDPAYLLDCIRSNNVTTAHYVPSMLHVFLETLESEALTDLRQVFCSGEALPATLAQRFHTLLPHTALHNLYGPTEAAIDVTAWTCTLACSRTTIPIGRPIANTQIYILDNSMQPTPIGVAGEIYIGGVQVARGYLNRPELTAQRFLSGALPDDRTARIYKTGDLGRWLADGNIEFLGRNDSQVKLRGFRIELEEIEARLAKFNGIREAVAVVRGPAAGDKRLLAYYTTTDGREISADELRTFLARKLPEYMVPTSYVWLESMLVSHNGKLDRNALPEPEVQSHPNRDFEAPEGEIEEHLARIWCDLLRVQRIGRHDSFFAIGGHSLLAARSVLRIRQQYDINLEVREIFEFPTLSLLGGEMRNKLLAQFDDDDVIRAAAKMAANRSGE